MRRGVQTSTWLSPRSILPTPADYKAGRTEAHPPIRGVAGSVAMGGRSPDDPRYQSLIVARSHRRLISLMKVLAIDIGGTHVKMLVSGEKEARKFPSGGKLTPSR